jgi:hypothetical protein
MHEHVIAEGTTSSYTSGTHQMHGSYSTYHAEKVPSHGDNSGRDIVRSHTVMHALVDLASSVAVPSRE